MTNRRGRHLAVVVMITLVGCGRGPTTTAPTTPAAGRPSPSASATPSPAGEGATSDSTIKDMMELEAFAPLEPGTYSIDADLDPSTPLRVVYDIPAHGWSQWIGAAKFSDQGTTCSSDGCPGNPSHVAVSITTVVNLVADGCHDHLPADP